jgi:hypothetical protein
VTLYGSFTLPIAKPGNAIGHYVLRVPGSGRRTQTILEQVRISRAPPFIDSVDIEVAGVRIRRWKAALEGSAASLETPQASAEVSRDDDRRHVPWRKREAQGHGAIPLS